MIIDESGRDRKDVWFGMEKKKKRSSIMMTFVYRSNYLFYGWQEGYSICQAHCLCLSLPDHTDFHRIRFVRHSVPFAHLAARNHRNSVVRRCAKVALQRLTLMLVSHENKNFKHNKKCTVVHNLLRLLLLNKFKVSTGQKYTYYCRRPITVRSDYYRSQA